MRIPRWVGGRVIQGQGIASAKARGRVGGKVPGMFENQPGDQCGWKEVRNQEGGGKMELDQ